VPEGDQLPKFIPLLANGSPDKSLPSYLKARVFLDFRTPATETISREELLRHIFNKPRFVRPPQGSSPVFSNSVTTRANVQPNDPVGYCKRCGAIPGKPSTCTGGYSHHDFVQNSGPLYCIRCGAVPGVPSSCTGGYTHHSFNNSIGREYCNRCGAITGEATKCTGGYTHHDFVPWTGPVFCRRCSALSGTPTQCTGGYTHHDFVKG